MKKERAINIFSNAVSMEIPHYLCKDGETADEIARESLRFCQQLVEQMRDKGALRIDKMAHSIMEFRPSGHGVTEHDGYTAFYHENCLYSVANKEHSIVSLVYASSPYHAIEKIKVQ